MAFRKGSFYCKAEKLLLRLHLEHRRIVVAEVIVRPLPQVRVGFGDDLDFIIGHGAVCRLPGPTEIMDVNVHITPPESFSRGVVTRQGFRIYENYIGSERFCQ